MVLDFLIFYGLILGFMVLFFLLAVIVKDNSIVDIAWGLGVVVTAVISLIYFGEVYSRKLAITIMAVLWGFRLASYIVLRKRGQGEDFRYKVFRERWGKHFIIKSLVNIFLFQGTLQFVLVLPVLLVNRSSASTWTLVDTLAAAIFLLGFLIETAADWQMHRFKKKPENKGKLLTHGIWKYSRHPNYFGETMLWWGLGFLAITVKGGIWALLSPVLVTGLLLFFSGIPLLEKKYRDRPDFQAYKARTSVFFPWLKKKSPSADNH